MRRLRVHELPERVPAAELAGCTCVVIDVLRATTTITYALAAGAREVAPCLEVEHALQLAREFPHGSFVLGGERGGKKIVGFELGNSPTEYTAASVGGKSVIFTTTNGTRALLHYSAAKEILLGSFANLSAVVKAISDAEKIEIVCAGTDGLATEEDLLLAGAIVDRLAADDETLNEQARGVRKSWNHLTRGAPVPNQDTLASALRSSRGGQNLVEIGLDPDIEDAAIIDRFSIVPRYHSQTKRVTSL